MKVIYNRVALIGLGLIAGSMAHAMRRHGLAGEIVGTARSPETRDIAREIGLCDRVTDSAAEAVKGADLIVLAVPVGAMGRVAGDIAPHLATGATVTDVGSVKGDVIAAVGPHLPEGVHFIPGHPLAGTEHSGPRAGFAELFENRYTLLTPVAGSDAAAVAGCAGSGKAWAPSSRRWSPITMTLCWPSPRTRRTSLPTRWWAWPITCAG